MIAFFFMIYIPLHAIYIYNYYITFKTIINLDHKKRHSNFKIIMSLDISYLINSNEYFVVS